MRKITSMTLLVVLFALSAHSFAGNWSYNTASSKWIKNITPEMLQFNKQTTASVQGFMTLNGGAANPNPMVTSTTGQDLSNGYFVVTGGQITASTVTANVTKGFALPDTSIISNALRYAAASSTVTDGFKSGVGGYVNLSWYVPAKYNRTNYSLQVSDSVYTSVAASVSFTTYDELDALKFTTATNAAAGWKYFTIAQTGTFVPFRVKLGLPNTTNLVAYIKTPRFELTSVTEPAPRTVTVTTSAEGTVTPAFGNLHDQDIEVFTIAPVEGKTIDVVTYNGSVVTPVVHGKTFTYTTPLLTANATLDVTYKTDGTTGLSGTKNSTVVVSGKAGLLTIQGLTRGLSIEVYAATGKLVHRSVSAQSVLTVGLAKGVYMVNIAGEISKVIL